ncbi:MAG: rhodanese-like domain-containing protein [Thermomicrobiales bacterium]
MFDDQPLSGSLEPVELQDLLQRHTALTMIDVRTPAEFSSAHIPGSYNVPLDQLPEHADLLRSAGGEPVVLICRSGNRARQAETTLLGADLPRVHVLQGGLAAWEAQRLPLRRGATRWSLERQVRGVAGALVLGGVVAGWLVWPPLTALAAAVGGGLAFSAVTDTCGLAMLLSRLPYNRQPSCDISGMLQQMAAERRPSQQTSAASVA